MRKIMWIVLLWASPVMGQSAPVDLRGAAGCGPLKEQYRVKVDKTKHAVMQPEAGKALVYVIVEEYPRPQDWTYVGNITTRVGLDGNWVGANYGESYVSFAVEPGEHHLCADWQSVLKSRQRLSDAMDLAAEAGKTYFYRAKLWSGNPESQQRPGHDPDLRLMEMDASQGMLMVSKTARSEWKKK